MLVEFFKFLFGSNKMGGTREGKLDPSTTENKKDSAGGTIMNLRYHENKGEIHFHDDKKNLKCVVPPAEWWSAWNKLSTLQIDKWSYPDVKNKTVLCVGVGLVQQESSTSLDIINASIESVQISDNFKKLDEFTIR